MGVSRSSATTTQPSFGKRLVGIEGLRGLAATGVLIMHTRSLLSTHEGAGPFYAAAGLGSYGLTLFFVLSGFLLYLPFATSILGSGPRPGISRYFRNRILRIYPAYIVIFLTVALVFGLANKVTPGMDASLAVGRITDPLTWASNVLLIGSYIPETIQTGLGVSWSLTAEIAFYLILPALFLGGCVLVRRRIPRLIAASAPVIVMIALGVSGAIFAALAQQGLSETELHQWSWGRTWTAVFDRSIVSQADLFGYGMAVALVLAQLRRLGVVVAPLKKVLLVGIAVAAACAGFWFGGPVTTNLIGVAAAILVLVVVLPGPNPGTPANSVARFFDLLPLRYLGLISYSSYLWHIPVIWWLYERRLYDPATLQGFFVSTLVVFAVTTVLATITYYTVERPALKLKFGRAVTVHVPSRPTVAGSVDASNVDVR
jgi:peptidoglycan/LPS O-acetylase OafA/YrhL